MPLKEPLIDPFKGKPHRTPTKEPLWIPLKEPLRAPFKGDLSGNPRASFKGPPPGTAVEAEVGGCGALLVRPPGKVG